MYTPSPVHSLHPYPPVPTPRQKPIFTYVTSNPPSPSYDLSSESVTPKGNPIPRKNPTNPVPNVPDDPDSDPSSSYSSLSDSSDKSDEGYNKQGQHNKNNKINAIIKRVLTLSRSVLSLQLSYLNMREI